MTVSGIVEAFKGYHLWFNRSCSLLHDLKTLKSTARAILCYVLIYFRNSLSNLILGKIFSNAQ